MNGMKGESSREDGRMKEKKEKERKKERKKKGEKTQPAAALEFWRRSERETRDRPKEMKLNEA